jgi:hypothetical protein
MLFICERVESALSLNTKKRLLVQKIHSGGIRRKNAENPHSFVGGGIWLSASLPVVTQKTLKSLD